jgi:hypothetical protein
MLDLSYKRTATIPKSKGDPATGIHRGAPSHFRPRRTGWVGGKDAGHDHHSAITIHLRRRRHDERVESYGESKVTRAAEPIRDALSTWAASIGDRLVEAEPEMPPGVDDRPAEIWEPLLAIAD